MTTVRWQSLMKILGVAENATVFEALQAAYSENHRHYHTTQHIDDCLRQFDSVAPLAMQPAELELALWFHDAIYDPMGAQNEEKSARWACEFLASNGAQTDRIERVKQLILATRHQSTPNDPDAQLLVDIDLSILGANERDYERFETNVRKEYRWVPGFLFRKKRAEILQSFLDRSHIYQTEPFRSRYENQARVNLARAVAALSQSA